MSDDKTKEPQNQSQIEDYRRLGPAAMGPWSSHIWREDPSHMSFLMSRYKFVSKMSVPNLLLQSLTTKIPDDDQIEVAINAMESAIQADSQID